MRSDKSTFFVLLDNYVRTQHGCRLTELDLWTEEKGYNACFRPVEAVEGSSRQYRYVRIATEHFKAALIEQRLPKPLVEQLDAALAELKKEI